MIMKNLSINPKFNKFYIFISRFQVFPYAFNKQTGHGIYRSRNVRLEHVPTTMLGFLPGRRLFP